MNPILDTLDDVIDPEDPTGCRVLVIIGLLSLILYGSCILWLLWPWIAGKL